MRKIRRVIITFFGMKFLFEKLAYTFTFDVNGRHNDMAGFQISQLKDTLAQVGLNNIHAMLNKEIVHVALFGKHRLALDHLLNTMVTQNAIYNGIEFVGILSPMN